MGNISDFKGGNAIKLGQPCTPKRGDHFQYYNYSIFGILERN